MTRVNTHNGDSTFTEEYDDPVERDARYDEVVDSGRQPYRGQRHHHGGDLTHNVTWYEPRRGDPQFDSVTHLNDNPAERRRR